MTDRFINIHPRRIETLEEVEDILSQFSEAERLGGIEDVGVAILQNNHLGSSYHIISRREFSSDELSHCERYCYFYPRSYFEDLRTRLSRKQEDYQKVGS